MFTAVERYHTLVRESPFIVDATRTVVWTQGPSIVTKDVVPTEASQMLTFGEIAQAS